MKKIFILMLFAVMAIGVQAQEHLKFQGIPIDGTFSQFEAKLNAKGWVYDYESEDARVYDGVFGGMNGWLYLHRTPKSKKIYSVSFCAEYVNSKSSAQEQCRLHKEALRRTYPDAHEWEPESGGVQFDLDNGMISCKIIGNDLIGYASLIQYVDDINSQKYLSERDSDY